MVMNLARANGRAALARTASRSSPVAPARPGRRPVVTRAGEANLFVNLLASTAAGGLATAVTLITAEDTDAELARLPTVEGEEEGETTMGIIDH